MLSTQERSETMHNPGEPIIPFGGTTKPTWNCSPLNWDWREFSPVVSFNEGPAPLRSQRRAPSMHSTLSLWGPISASTPFPRTSEAASGSTWGHFLAIQVNLVQEPGVSIDYAIMRSQVKHFAAVIPPILKNDPSI
jgi:hypothetical protein